jgi:VanZ family protein
VLRLFDSYAKYTWFNKGLLYLALLISCYAAFKPIDEAIIIHMNDKSMHLIAFFVLSFLLHLSHQKISFIKMLILLSCFGMGIEIVQAFLPHRSFELYDWLADIGGISIYLCFVAPFIKSRFSKYRYAPD